MIKHKVEKSEIENFLYLEAELLDTRKLDDWLSLFTDDAIYWMPCNEDDYDPRTHVSYIYDDRKLMGDRIWRLQSGLAYGQEPPSKTTHMISNIRITDQTEDGVKVSANFLIIELRHGIQTSYSGRFIYQLRYVDDAWKIVLKKINLLNNNDPLGNISFLF